MHNRPWLGSGAGQELPVKENERLSAHVQCGVSLDDIRKVEQGFKKNCRAALHSLS